MQTLSSRFHWRPFLTLHAVAMVLFFSWLIPFTRAYWNALDEKAFLFLNLSLIDKPFTQIFWALANVKLCDLVGAIFMALFFVLYIKDALKNDRKTRFAQFLFVCFWGEIGILFMKQVLENYLHKIDFIRESPTFIYSNVVLLSEAIPWLRVKDFARSSFPSDHAEIIFQWTAFIFFFGRWRYGLLALPWTIFFALPRIIGGAHWVSDALAGSAPVVLIMTAWACYSPLYAPVMNFFLRFAYRKHKHVTAENTINEHTSTSST